MDSSARSKFLGVIPPIALLSSGLALAISHSVDAGSTFLSNLETSAFVEMYWSVIAAVVIVFFFRKPGTVTRTVAWVSGAAGYLVVVTINMISLFGSALSNSVPTIHTHNLVAMGLTSLAWVIGIGWAFEALAFSVNSGDWNQTIWAKMRKHTPEK